MPQGFSSPFSRRRGEVEVRAEGWVLVGNPWHGSALPAATLPGSAPRELPQHHPNSRAGDLGEKNPAHANKRH